MQSDVSALRGRGELLARIESRLGAGGGVAVHGPAGIGKTVLLDAAASAACARGELVVRLRPVRSERLIPYAGIADLIPQLPRPAREALPPAQRRALAALRQGVTPRAGAPALALRLVLPLLLLHSARERPVLLVLDDCQWLDAASAELIAFAMRRRPGPRVRVIAAERRPYADAASTGRRLDADASAPIHPLAAGGSTGRRLDADVASPVRPLAAGGSTGRRLDAGAASPVLSRVAGGSTGRRAVRLCPAPAIELTVPPLEADDLTELLEARGLPCRTASRLHETSAGNPFLALTLGAAQPPGEAWRPAPLPEAARELLRDQLAALPADVAHTLLVAALATDPTVTLLRRAGREDAVRDLRVAAAAGVVAVAGEQIRFTPPLLATVLAEDAPAGDRTEAHTALAAAAADPVQALRHRALRSSVPDAAVARCLADAAGRASGRLAAELYLLAADRCPHTHAHQRLDWLVAAARGGLAGGAAALAGRAAEAVLAAADAPAGHRVRARLVLIDLAGQGLAGMGEMFAAALAEAGDDPALSAPVRLRRTWAALLTGDPDRAADEAARTALAARRAGDPTTEAMALSVLAQIERLRGEPGWADTLTQALVLPAAPAPDWLHYGPRYVAARFAMMDDRLTEARAALLGLLVVAEHDRIGEARVEVLRSLSEVATRAGPCREALSYAHRAVRVAQRAGLSPGPTWYTAAIAELAGGSLAAAAGFARRGVRASEQEGDTLYLRRNLHALGQAELRAGATRAGVAALRRLRDLEAGFAGADPMIARWHGDLAGGLAALGEHAEAVTTLVAGRAAAERLGENPGWPAIWTGRPRWCSRRAGRLIRPCCCRRPRPSISSSCGSRSSRATRCSCRAARNAAGAGTRRPGSRSAPRWRSSWPPTRSRGPSRPSALAGTSAPGTPIDLGLTSTELRIAVLVRDGASNREIAGRLYLSVKTVEATLTRIYRKLGVRSRTQLSSRLPTVVPELTTSA